MPRCKGVLRPAPRVTGDMMPKEMRQREWALRNTTRVLKSSFPCRRGSSGWRTPRRPHGVANMATAVIAGTGWRHGATWRPSTENAWPACLLAFGVCFSRGSRA